MSTVTSGLSGFEFDHVLGFDGAIHEEDVRIAEQLVQDEAEPFMIREGHRKAPKTTCRRVESAPVFKNWLDEISIRACPPRSSLPILIVDAHGDEDGLAFPDGTRLCWTVFADSLAKLNMATRVNLFVIMSACFGAEVARQIRVQERAPFYGLLAPRKSIAGGVLLEDLRTFLRSAFETRDPAKAILAVYEARPAAREELILLFAQHLFHGAWKGWSDSHFSRKGRDETVNRLLTQVQEGDRLTLDSIAATRKKIRSDLPEAAARYSRRAWETFFGVDLEPSNALRFPYEPERWTDGRLTSPTGDEG